MKILSIIPARGGSKGITRKNVRILGGSSLVGRTIMASLGTTRITRTIVSTDDMEIANVALEYGAEVVGRPPAISKDDSLSEDALLHVLDYLKTRRAYEPDIVVWLQCTSPLTTSEDIDGTIQTLIDENADSALSVVPFHYFLWDKDANGINHDKTTRLRRQERDYQFVTSDSPSFFIYILN